MLIKVSAEARLKQELDEAAKALGGSADALSPEAKAAVLARLQQMDLPTGDELDEVGKDGKKRSFLSVFRCFGGEVSALVCRQANQSTRLGTLI